MHIPFQDRNTKNQIFFTEEKKNYVDNIKNKIDYKNYVDYILYKKHRLIWK